MSAPEIDTFIPRQCVVEAAPEQLCDHPGCSVLIVGNWTSQCIDHGTYLEENILEGITWISESGCGLHFCPGHSEFWLGDHTGMEVPRTEGSAASQAAVFSHTKELEPSGCATSSRLQPASA